MIQVLIAFLAGILTVGAPCILPLLPILLGTSIGQESKLRPLFITLGFILTFSTLSIAFSVFTHILGISQNSLRIFAVILLGIFGMFMIWPTAFEKITNRLMGKFINKVSESGDKVKNNNVGGFVIGVTLGIIWAPCAGPVLASILTLIATTKEISKAAILMLSYSAGAGIPMLLIAYSGQWASKKIKKLAPYTRRMQQVFGILIILLAIAILFQYDVLIQTKLSQNFKSINLEEKLAKKSEDKKNPLKVTRQDKSLVQKNPAPEFIGINRWFNSPPLTLQQLKGKVVMVDFWTYSCINCVRTLPYVKKWYDSYKDRNFVVVGVHTPEFAFEKNQDNVARALKVHDIQYPVAMDNNYLTWNAYNNNVWPAHYLINQNGDIVYTHFGEGAYEETENKIRLLVGLEKENEKEKNENGIAVNSPEMYFGMKRQEQLHSSQKASKNPQKYNLPGQLPLNNFAFEGTWQFEDEYARLVNANGKVKLRFSSAKVYLVAKPDGKPAHATIFIDGKKVNEIIINESKLYTLYDSDNYGEHTLEIEFKEAGVELFTFTFG